MTLLPLRLLSESTLLVALTLSTQAGGIRPAEEAHSEAVRLLNSDDAPAAEEAVRRALSESSHFLPEREIEVTPEKGVLFDDMIAEARAAYRERRGRYFQTLGQALSAQARWAEARKALWRSVRLRPTAEVFMAMASDPGLTISQRVETWVKAYFAPGANRPAVEESLLESGAFASPETLQAVFDRERFSRELATEFPELKVVVAPFPEIRAATSSGTLVTSDLLEAGVALVVYLPVAGCNRCSEELDGVGRALAAGADAARRDKPEFAVAAFVEERDLVTARRIVRLLGMTIEVGRVDRMPEGIEPAAQGEILMVARRGILQVRIPLGGGLSSNQIRDRVAAVLGLLKPREPSPTSSSPVRMERSEGGGKALVTRVDRAVALEAGPVPIPDVYDQIDREVRSLLQESGASAAALEVLGELARLRGAGAAKARAFLALDKALPQTLLAAVKGIAPEVERQAGTDEGFYYLTVSEPSPSKRILLQRSFLDGSSLSHFDLIVDLQQGQSSVFWVGQPPEEPAGTQAVATAAVFFHESESCRGLRLIGEAGVIYEGCPAHLEEGEVVEAVEALVDPVPPADAPRFYRRGRIDSSLSWEPESALERAIRLFREGGYQQALSAFEEASRQIDPVAPYDTTDLRYNIARCYQELGQGPKALELMETIGDAAYQTVVDERIGELEVATRR